jgi:hypothetical protein
MLTALEKRVSKTQQTFPLELPTGATEDVAVTWDIIDKSTAAYVKMVHEYDIAEVIKSMVVRNGLSRTFAVLPKPGNLDLDDAVVGFHDFYALLANKADADALRVASEPITRYILNGKHPRDDKAFAGWSRAFAMARKAKKTVLGVLSIDLPLALGDSKYKCGGTQHYVAFAFDTRIHRLYIFDSASKDPHADQSEVLFIMRFAFEALSKMPVAVEGLAYNNILQPGAGDRREENEFSYNNQNVFCHTWSMWFAVVFMNFYDSKRREDALAFIRSLSHRNQLLNLAMIKRFAGWLTVSLKEESRDTGFATRAYERAKEKGDNARTQEVLVMYALQRDKYVGLNYIYNYKNKSFVSVEHVCRLRHVKMDIDVLDGLEHVDIGAYIKESRRIRCPIGWQLYTPTRRCRKVPLNAAIINGVNH